jgi:hypothetical protein
MQDAHVGSWARNSQVPAEMFESVRGLNHRFLDLVSAAPDGWSGTNRGMPGLVSAQVAPLSPAQKAAASGCPYALFDLRFQDEGYWRTRLQSAGHWRVAEEPSVDRDIVEFVRVALFFAWHVASTAKLAAQLLLGMHEDTASAFRSAAIDCLPPLAKSEAANLTARWNGCARYWSALTDAASRPNSAELRHIQLYGLQLAAAACLQ